MFSIYFSFGGGRFRPDAWVEVSRRGWDFTVEGVGLRMELSLTFK